MTLIIGYGTAMARSLVGDLATDKAYSVNIIAYDNCPKGHKSQRIAVLADFTNDAKTGDLIVDLDKRNLIYLTPGDDFRVLDSNACAPDGDGALLQLPPMVSTDFELWIRLVGKPETAVEAFTCANVLGEATIICSTDKFAKTRMTGKGEPSFSNATNQLLFLTNALLGCSPCKLFDPTLEDFFWVWNTTGNPHAQAWFVEKD